LTQLDFNLVRYLQNGAEDSPEMLFSTLAESDAIEGELHRKVQEAAREQTFNAAEPANGSFPKSIFDSMND
jgi:hypothetical protein